MNSPDSPSPPPPLVPGAVKYSRTKIMNSFVFYVVDSQCFTAQLFWPRVNRFTALDVTVYGLDYGPVFISIFFLIFTFSVLQERLTSVTSGSLLQCQV